MNRFYTSVFMAAIFAALSSGCEYFDLSPVEAEYAKASGTATPGADAGSSADSGSCTLKTWYRDKDQDKFGDPKDSFESCLIPGGYVQDKTDCNDNAASIHPGAPELCNSIDDNCNGTVDDTKKSWWIDNDGDGYGDKLFPFPGDCKGNTSKLVDNDKDCDDKDAKVHPGATEVCNGKDDDCNGKTDGENSKDIKVFYKDTDLDGFGQKIEVKACFKVPGLSESNDDCDDTNSKAYPKAAEFCDGLDNDCDGSTDEGLKQIFYRDADGDGWGVKGETTESCMPPPVGFAMKFGDCDEASKLINPSAAEVCDGIDNDCNGKTDEGLLISVWRDVDGDGYGDPKLPNFLCEVGDGKYVTNNTDCNDSEAKAYTGAKEVCDSIDNDCNGKTDESAEKPICDDGSLLTTDSCDAKNGCLFEDVLISFECVLPKGYPKEDGFECMSAAFYGTAKGFDGTVFGKGHTLTAKDVCGHLKAGDSLHVNSFVQSELFSPTWVGGLYVEVFALGEQIKGTPGLVTVFAPGLDFDFVLDDFDICK